ncbi:cysteine-rich motor neuron 1 protein [Nilaparvata lugens]|uniref:cysteine-rich motor neuron 1 protein n=1 Tax=Nilaparvata lugens TaxID=108931 RepID=UPI00193E773B|nr:cysteine-rich motor neuron 1 protein [Nilaparvata lugens]
MSLPGECCPVCDESSVVTLPPNCQAFNCTLRCVHGFVRDNEGCFTCQCQQDECRLECRHGYVKDKQGNKLCECADPGAGGHQCPSMAGCRKTCAHGFRRNKAGCPICKCDSCKPLDDCVKTCAHGFANNTNGCPVCKCLPSPDSSIQSTAVNAEGKSYCFHLEDDTVHEDGEVWFDGCRHCYCRDGTELCSPLLCPPLNCSTHLLNTTGCCPTCPGEEVSLKKHVVCGEGGHVEGDEWHLGAGVDCLCQDGRTYCHAPECPPAPCDYQALQTSDFGCAHCSTNASLKLTKTCALHPTEAVWRESACVSCACNNGRPICFEETCTNAARHCKHLLHIKGRCCPVCLDADLPTAAPTTMQTLTPNQAGCKVTAGNGTATLYNPGEVWAISDCVRCECLDVGQTLCTKEVCPFSCAGAVKTPGKCCPVCPTNSEGGSMKDGSRGAVFIVVVSLIACTMLVLVYLVGRQCRMRRQVKLSAYGCPPPQYHQYKIVTAFEAAQAPSIRTTDKSALSPV